MWLLKTLLIKILLQILFFETNIKSKQKIIFSYSGVSFAFKELLKFFSHFLHCPDYCRCFFRFQSQLLLVIFRLETANGKCKCLSFSAIPCPRQYPILAKKAASFPALCASTPCSGSVLVLSSSFLTPTLSNKTAIFFLAKHQWVVTVTRKTAVSFTN